MAASTLDLLYPKAKTSGLGGTNGYTLLNQSSGTGGQATTNQSPDALDRYLGNQTKTGTLPSTITLGPTKQDYAGLIENDPAYLQLKNLLSAQGISDATHLRGALQQALINFGAVPKLPQDILNQTGLDTGLTSSLASNNPFSILKQLAQSYQDSQDATKNQLAARGILNSGETGYQLGRIGQQQGQSQYDATNSLLGNLDTLESQYAAGRQAASQQLAQGALTAENTAAQGGATTGGGTATYDPATGLWKDSNGGYYDQSGNTVTLPGSNGPTGGQISSPPPPTTISGPGPQAVPFGGTPSPQLPTPSALNALFKIAQGGTATPV